MSLPSGYEVAIQIDGWSLNRIQICLHGVSYPAILSESFPLGQLTGSAQVHIGWPTLSMVPERIKPFFRLVIPLFAFVHLGPTDLRIRSKLVVDAGLSTIQEFDTVLEKYVYYAAVDFLNLADDAFTIEIVDDIPNRELIGKLILGMGKNMLQLQAQRIPVSPSLGATSGDVFGFKYMTAALYGDPNFSPPKDEPPLIETWKEANFLALFLSKSDVELGAPATFVPEIQKSHGLPPVAYAYYAVRPQKSFSYDYAVLVSGTVLQAILAGELNKWFPKLPAALPNDSSTIVQDIQLKLVVGGLSVTGTLEMTIPDPLPNIVIKFETWAGLAVWDNQWSVPFTVTTIDTDKWVPKALDDVIRLRVDGEVSKVLRASVQSGFANVAALSSRIPNIVGGQPNVPNIVLIHQHVDVSPESIVISGRLDITGGQNQQEIVANMRTKEFHRYDCEWARRILRKNVRKFTCLEDLFSNTGATYNGCGYCMRQYDTG
jgi:hypothetical protein